ncbi:restriction endonuclease subunit S [Streptomyces sp. CB02460]|uniref:restriction endonuclease subunit S n=1 Tax=Streptomyces sp. CB02460 TaxID=1703941 RepID=UPI001F5B6830|nr:restriction endonuclease subunit S [Streptomyces sp. CB02460]
MELPAGWAKARLDEIAEVRLGRQRSPRNHSGDQMRPYLRAANVGWSGLKVDDVKEMNFTDDEVAIYRLVKGDIVLGEASGTASEVGKPAIWNDEIEDCCFQNTLIRVRSRLVNSKFLLHYLRYEALRGGFAEGARGVGIHHLGAARLSAWPMRIPPLSEQARIVEALEGHLSRLDAGLATLSRAAIMAPSLVRSLNTAATEGRLVGDVDPEAMDFDSVRREIWSRVKGNKKYKEPCQPDLGLPVVSPEGWPILSLESVTDPVRLIRYGILMPKVKSGGTVPYVEVKDLRGCHLKGKRLHLTSAELDEKFSGARIKGGDIVMAVRGSYDRSAVVPDSMAGANVSRDVVRISPLPGLDPKFLQLYLQSMFAQRYLKKHARGVAVKGVNISSLRALPVAVPPIAVQRMIADEASERLSVVQRTVEAIAKSSARADTLRRAILDRAFTGALVPQDPTDEPAAALLARIQADRAAQPKAKRARRAPVAPRKPKAPTGRTPAPAPSPTPAPTHAVQQEFDL